MSRTTKLWKEAATTILVKRGVQLGGTQRHGLKLLILERSAKSKFMPSTCVFPGGIISKSDFSSEWDEVLRARPESRSGGVISHEYGIHPVTQPQHERPPMLQGNNAQNSSMPNNIAFRLCALRETFEESGILLYKPVTDSTSEVDSSALKEWRDKVNKDSSEFVKMCRALSVAPDVWSLFEWTNWLTPTQELNRSHSQRRYDTMFYLACVDKAVEAEHDEKEIVASKWFSPVDLLDNYYREKLLMAPPQIYETCRFLHPELQEWDDVERYARHRAMAGCERWLPVRVNCTDGVISLLPGDELYPEFPDLEGVDEVLEIEDSIKQSRHKCERLHRIEIRGLHNIKVVCTIPPKFNHVPPLQWISL